MSPSRTLVPKTLLFLALMLILLSGCSPSSETAALDITSDPVACVDLVNVTAPGLEVVAAEEAITPTEETNPFTGQPLPPLPPHCKVTGKIDGDINFELHLPLASDWNGRFAMGGGGGFVGSVQNQLLQPGLTSVSALEAGYATAGTDTGHQASGIDGSWALDNDTAERNFADRAIHVVTDVSKKLTEHHYGRSIEYSYFMGCSRGGGQAMIESQRFPEDFDGIVAAAPAYSWMNLGAGFLQNQKAIYPDPGELESPVITAENRALLEKAILGQCDALDGVEDGILTDPRQCDFDPASLPKCSSGPGDECVTEAQLSAIETIYDGPEVGGEEIFHGFPYGGENDRGGWDVWITGGGPYTQEGNPNLHFAFGTQMYKYLVYDDPDFDYSSYDWSTWAEDTAAADDLLSADDTDLSAFRDRGGKMIFWHGWSDPALTALGTVDYYQAMSRDTEGADEFTRLYMLPGVLHCSGGPGADRVDWLSHISNWVEKGQGPEAIVAAKAGADGTTQFTRTLCPYPTVASYDGTGDPGDAASYSCTES